MIIHHFVIRAFFFFIWHHFSTRMPFFVPFFIFFFLSCNDTICFLFDYTFCSCILKDRFEESSLATFDYFSFFFIFSFFIFYFSPLHILTIFFFFFISARLEQVIMLNYIAVYLEIFRNFLRSMLSIGTEQMPLSSRLFFFYVYNIYIYIFIYLYVYNIYIIHIVLLHSSYVH